MRDVRDIATILLLVIIMVWLGLAAKAWLDERVKKSAIIVESVEFNESCRPTHLFVVNMKGHPIRVFDCSEE